MYSYFTTRNFKLVAMKTSFPRCAFERIGNSPPPDKHCFHTKVSTRLKFKIIHQLDKRVVPLS